MREAEHDWLDDLAAAVADGRSLDWDALESSASDDGRRQIIRRLRSVEAVGRAHASLTFISDTSDSLSARSLLPGIDDTSTPAQWGSLRIIERVGRGRFGDVYRAWDPTLARGVALKLLRRREEFSSSDLEVIEEGRLMARVRHPNVVTIYGAQRIDGRTGLWMEFVEGGRTLESELKERGVFSESDIVAVGGQLCHALTAVHDAGLVHRDVKASNVMRDGSERVVLGDFGTGHELAEPQQGRQGLAGTPAYIAPEVLRGEAATCQSDIYSLGVLLFHLATGAYPVNGRTIHELRLAHDRRDRASLAGLRPDLNERLVATIERALNPQRSLRFDQAVDFHAALCRQHPDSRDRRRTIIAIGSALTFTIATAVLGYWGVRLSSSQSETPRASSITRSEMPAAAPEIAADRLELLPNPKSDVISETASASGSISGESDPRSAVLLPFGNLKDYAAAANAFLRAGNVAKARLQAAMVPDSDI